MSHHVYHRTKSKKDITCHRQIGVSSLLCEIQCYNLLQNDPESAFQTSRLLIKACPSQRNTYLYREKHAIQRRESKVLESATKAGMQLDRAQNHTKSSVCSRSWAAILCSGVLSTINCGRSSELDSAHGQACSAPGALTLISLVTKTLQHEMS